MHLLHGAWTPPPSLRTAPFLLARIFLPSLLPSLPPYPPTSFRISTFLFSLPPNHTHTNPPSLPPSLPPCLPPSSGEHTLLLYRHRPLALLPGHACNLSNTHTLTLPPSLPPSFLRRTHSLVLPSSAPRPPSRPCLYSTNHTHTNPSSLPPSLLPQANTLSCSTVIGPSPSFPAMPVFYPSNTWTPALA